MKVKFIYPDATEIVVEGTAGESVMQCARSTGIEGIVGECGGAMACATCHAYLDEAWIPMVDAPGELERAMLTGCIDVKEASRLTCQIILSDNLDGVSFEIPVDQS